MAMEHSPMRYDGKVVVVTGAGGGLGRAYALDFAARGAKVIVNDLGGDIKGGGASFRAADKVVNEIKSKGGIAVANYDSVEDGEKVMQTALDNFGKIDILVNNAGILRDRSFARTSDLDWDLIHRVHLRGSFMCTRAAWEHMKKQKYGRIIMTTSAAGIYGNFGQANYSAAKLGLLGLSNTLAIEGKKYNILCNTIAPLAGSRLTETVMSKDILDLLKPEYVAPLVLYLTHDSCEETGGLFEVGVGQISKLRWQKTKGVALLKDVNTNYTPEEVRDNWAKITDFEDEPWYPENIQVANSRAYGVIGDLVKNSSKPKSSPVSSSNKDIDPELAKKAVFPPSKVTYTDKEVILYALGVGVSTTQEDHLKFIYEYSSEFSVLPTFGVIPAQGSSMGLFGGSIPGLKIDPTKILHGEQYLELYKPFTTSGTLTTRSKVMDVLDKGSGAVLIIDMETVDEKGEKVCFNQFTTFVQGAGGFGGKRSSEYAKVPVAPPNRAPDASIKEKTDIDQAALYRLSGDRNPLHLDPAFAAMGGFKQPILHGLASFGFAGRAVLKQYCNNDVTKFKAMKVRFNRPVLPGQTLQTDMWKEGNRIHFTTKIVETGTVALAGAYVDLVEGPVASVGATPSGSSLQAEAVFNEMAKRVCSNPDLAKKVGVMYQFNVTKGGKIAGSWTADLKNNAGSVYAGTPKEGKAQCTITISDEDMVLLSTGKLDAQKAFMTGKLKIGGNMMLAQKLSLVFQDQPAAADKSSGPSLKAEAFFNDMAKRVSSNPGLAKKVGVIYQFNITKGGKTAGSWTADLKSGSGSVYAGTPKKGKAQCTITMSDDDMVAMATGKLDGQKAFMSGRMKIGGNMMLAQKLSQLFAEQSKL